MKNIFYIRVLFLLLISFALYNQSLAQGCVAVRNMSSCSLFDSTSTISKWQVSVNYRYFKSFRHFRGKEEEEERVEQGTEVINHDNSVLLGLSYNFNSRWSASVVIPYLSIDRSSLYEHYGNKPNTNPRFHTQSSGVGDIRLNVYRSLLNHKRFQLIAGVGAKLPTGNFHDKDYFHKKDQEGNDSLVYKVVDQSIQPGDGGFGFSTELNLNYQFTRKFSVYGTAFYLFNPRNTNGVKRRDDLELGIPNTPSSAIALSNEFSVADQYLFRLGVSYQIKRVVVSLGGRYEGVAAEDLIGDSDGFRRPGYIISIEPSAVYSFGRSALALNLPIAWKRNRVQNTIDMAKSEMQGTEIIGDAAFADWLLSISYSYKL